MLSFLYNYGLTILVLTIPITYFIYRYRTKGKEKAIEELRNNILILIKSAKENFTPEQEEEIIVWVADNIHPYLPPILRNNMTDEQLEVLIKELLHKGLDMAERELNK